MKIQLDLNLKEDAELRKEIREMIEGQVKSITRSEIKNIIKEVATDKLDVLGIFESVLNKAIKKELKFSNFWNTSEYITEKANEIITEILETHLKTVYGEKK